MGLTPKQQVNQQIQKHIKPSHMKLLSRALLVLLLSGWCQALLAQASDSSEIIMVTVDIIARDRSEELVKYPQTKREEYYITIDLKNTQDTSVKIAIMNCTWFQSFTTDGDSLYLKPKLCDHNDPDYLKIPAHKSVRFYATLVNNKVTAMNTKRCFKIGFISMPFKDLFFVEQITKQERIKKYKTYWSKNVDLVEKLNTYEGELKEK